ncbi:MAG TPA: BrnT family toxin [Gammaproteobacteria bacterium]|nr:BrnT family toxin [Gammaproteobacteria bacterium]
MVLIFEWDDKKASQNIKKHGISFEEATTVFGDPFSITIYDPLHSREEDRFVILGMSDKNRILVVVHTERNDRIRIISARKATKKERKQYESNEK